MTLLSRREFINGRFKGRGTREGGGGFAGVGWAAAS